MESLFSEINRLVLKIKRLFSKNTRLFFSENRLLLTAIRLLSIPLLQATPYQIHPPPTGGVRGGHSQSLGDVPQTWYPIYIVVICTFWVTPMTPVTLCWGSWGSRGPRFSVLAHYSICARTRGKVLQRFGGFKNSSYLCAINQTSNQWKNENDQDDDDGSLPGQYDSRGSGETIQQC